MPPAVCLARRDDLSYSLQDQPYRIDTFLLRAEVYDALGFPDLAAIDTYKALLLIDEVWDESGELHEEALGSFIDHTCRISDTELAEILSNETHVEARDVGCIREVWGSQVCLKLSHHLAMAGCLQSAFDFAQRAIQMDKSTPRIERELAHIVDLASKDQALEANSRSLPERCFVRREVYPWNLHERDRHTQDSLDHLNDLMSVVAPKLQVATVDLPVLSNHCRIPNDKTSTQLGVFAKEDILPGEVVLRERSLLTANCRLHEPLCDACSRILPSQDDKASTEGPVSCEDCDDAVYCSQNCHDTAASTYHAAVCGLDTDFISKEVPAAESADALYTLLLLRALAMAKTQEVHPLELDEVKYIWGDFSESLNAMEDGNGAKTISEEYSSRTLPFSFSANILTPLHMLEKMDIPIFTAPNDLAELWVWNTLYAKFRGTASARISPRDGRPEVAAVHPLWCLANHRCDPNVEWEWAGEICFTARTKRQTRKHEVEPREGGILAGEEIFNHYVDIDLPVAERRAWGRGALGGDCMCERCIFEASL